ncbi:MAG: hypothetical protein CMH56_10535 [Myxococcales bacterium]|nr:hypothetical protein [Myxococcales bacterium]
MYHAITKLLFMLSTLGLLTACPPEVPPLDEPKPKTDCNDVEDGDAYIDECDMCVGGDTDKEPCEADCNGDYGGTAFIDECGECVGGETGQEPCPISPIIDAGAPEPPAETDAGAPEPPAETDAGTPEPPAETDAGTPEPPAETDAGTPEPPAENDAGTPEPPAETDAGTPEPPAETDAGSAGLDDETDAGAAVVLTDCNGDVDGTATTDECGNCVGGNTGNVACEQDCHGDWGGSAITDNCGDCTEGDTGLLACAEDCFGDWGGTAVPDCNNDCNGTAIVDECGDCVGGETGAIACEQDCAGEWGGAAVTDCNDECNGTAIADCNGDCNGVAALDQCGNCTGGNTGANPCIIGCMDADAANYDPTATAAGDCIYTVTFEVDMSCSGYASDDLTVHVHGFNTDDWSSGSVELFDDDGDGVWVGTTTAGPADYDYRVFAGEWDADFDAGTGAINPLGSEDLSALVTCASETDGHWNRQVSINDAPVNLEHVFGRCDACPVEGCTESGANNFDPDAEIDDESCAYDVSLSIGNITWPDSEYTLCGADDGVNCEDGALGSRIPGSVEVMMSNTAVVGGFSFKLWSTELNSSDVPSGGLVDAAGFITQISSDDLIAAYPSIDSGDSIPADSSGLLIDVPARVLVDAYSDEICVEFPTFSDAAGDTALSVERECGTVPPAAEISIGEVTDSQVEIWIHSEVNIGGAQFTVSGVSANAAGTASGGFMQELGQFTTNVGANGVVLLVSFANYLIPSTSNICASNNPDLAAYCNTDATQAAKLLTIDISSVDADEICLTDMTLSDGDGNRIIVESACKTVTP